jgi:O-antigen/teichoic acid export membrane protein
MILSGLRKILNQTADYKSQVARLASGNIIAAVIPFIFQPVIARLYNANDFSILAWYMTFISIISVFATGKFEMAIVIPEKEKDAKNLTILSFLLSALASVIVIIISISFYKSIAATLQTSEIIWIFAIGPGILFFCTYQVFFYLANRYSLYNSMSISKVNQNAGIVIFQLVLGLVGAGGIGLVFGRLVGYLISAVLLGWFTVKFSKLRKSDISWTDINKVARTYSNFPKHLVFSNLLAAIYTQLPFMYIAREFDSQIAGQFAFAMQMIMVPGLLISNAIGDVFRQKASELYRTSGRFDRLLIRTLKNSFLISVVPFMVLILFSTPIFKVIFGEQWILAGKFASVLSVMAFIGFIITPVDKAAIVVNKTSFEFWYQISRFVFNCIIVAISVLMSLSVFTYLYLLVVISIFHYIIDLVYSYMFSKEKAQYAQ